LPPSVHVDIVSDLASLDPPAWNALVGADDPFLEHAFLSALAASGVIGERTAWQPRFVVAFEDRRPIAALPLFLKWDSYGEFVFDWSWAEAYARAGVEYYPKLVAASPLTPVQGRRILGEPAAVAELTAPLLAKAREYAREIGASGIHVLFAEPAEIESLAAAGFLPRLGYQFHWLNRGYAAFDDFLSDLRSAKRKQILKERRTVAGLGLDIQVIEGDAVRPEHMEAIWRFYRDTSARKWGQAYLNRRTFLELGERYRDRLVLVLARRDGEYVAGTLNAQKGRVLYGRYWGAVEEFPCLHFECCYYRLIEYGIAKGLERVEAGAQGEHKFLRGYVTRPMWSAHELFLPSGHAAVGRWLEEERPQVSALIDGYNRQSPLKEVRAALG
jgi:hypothetical protein